jgi:tRNA dimethylallyltransferase
VSRARRRVAPETGAGAVAGNGKVAGRAVGLARNMLHQSPATSLALVGPTGSGKSAIALEVARLVPGVEIVSVDSMAVYRGMDIGTAKPTAPERAEVHHHLLDLVDPSVDYSVARFQADFRRALEDIHRRGARALLVGGTGLYLRAALDGLELPGRWPDVARSLDAEADVPGGTRRLHAHLHRLDPGAASRMSPVNRRRVVRALEVTIGSGKPFSSFGPGLGSYPEVPVTIVGIERRPEDLGSRIEARLDRQLADGLLEEVQGLARRPLGLSRTARQAVAYRELLEHVEGGVSLDEAVLLARRRARRLARRQRSWFRRDPRVRWVDGDDDPRSVARSLLQDWTAWPSSA